MSLFKQLWLAITLMLTLIFIGSCLVSTLSARSYLEQQLTMKNADNASALALSLTQQGADEVMLELTLSVQFDTGFYEMISLTDAEGNTAITRIDDQSLNDAPAWFIAMFPIDVEPGIASVQKGWQQLGTLTVRSHSRFAYGELWDSTKKLALVFFVAMIAAGVLGRYVLKRILHPLLDVVDQAQAIGDRRFITIDEPYTLEFKQVVSAMNTLSARIKQVLGQETRRLEKWQREAHVDKITGLMNREPFMQALDAALESDDVNSTGSLSLIRLAGLSDLNQIYGRKAIDSMLKDVGKELNRIVMSHSRWAACRMNGSDFAILAPRAMEAEQAAQDAQKAIQEIIENRSMDKNVKLPGSSTIYQHGETISEILTRLDGALLNVDTEGNSTIAITQKGDIQMTSVREQMEHWREVFIAAFRDHKFSLAGFPVINTKGELLHMESPVRLAHRDEEISAGRFLPWINRLELSGDLDQQVIDLALEEIAASGEPTCINLSVAAVVEPAFLTWLSERLSTHPEAAAKLWMEISEPMAFRHLTAFKNLCNRAKEFGTKIGIEHMGYQLSELGQLSDVGVDYLKVDAIFIRAINENNSHQNLLRNLCTVGHSIGMLVLGEGVRTEQEWATLKEIGLDGATGPGIRLS
ncbi:MAG: diguanylate cyclase (GGDEF)-like protein [Halieaceae bacterium]|jgi:diguanylate cyclase (GGDEF)-like protein